MEDGVVDASARRWRVGIPGSDPLDSLEISVYDGLLDPDLVRAPARRDRGAQLGKFMRLDLVATEVTVEEIQPSIERAWSDGVASGAVSGILAMDAGTAPGSDAAACPFEAEPGEDSYDAITLIAIAAAGRLAATIPERLLVRLFDEVIWPKLTARFGGSLKRAGDDE